ncbi:hypothetical protein FHG68_04775 [Leptospira weilii]|nr:hypothetical protein FHG67_04920 [Leptospira weilii]QDK26089.1 hypothetical protein FHG68_04775 [Leptospira weilii]
MSRERELNLAFYGSRDRAPGMRHKEVARRRGSVIPSLNKRLNISKLEKQQARYEARGRLSPSHLISKHYSLTSKTCMTGRTSTTQCLEEVEN